MIKMVGACPVCGQEMDEMSVRQTAAGVMCLECVFKQDFERRQGRGAYAPLAAAGVAPPAAATSNDGAVLGFLAGFLCGVVGIFVVFYLSKNPKMKSASVAGLVAQFVLGVMVRLLLVR